MTAIVLAWTKQDEETRAASAAAIKKMTPRIKTRDILDASLDQGRVCGLKSSQVLTCVTFSG